MAKSNIRWVTYILELLVVFMGVSAGFILQNKKDNARDRREELQYLEGFRDDIEINIENLEEQVSDDSLWLDNNMHLVRLIIADSLEYDSACIVVRRMSYFTNFSPRDITYLNIVNSGNFNLIRDYQLRNGLISYHKDLIDFAVLEDYFKDFSQNKFIPFMMINFSMFDGELINRKVHKSLEFENIFGTYFSLKQQRLTGYRELLATSDSILTKVEEAIDLSK